MGSYARLDGVGLPHVAGNLEVGETLVDRIGTHGQFLERSVMARV